ncbi:hypothetical protein BC832DRAFT_589461 [Gaertneriomyces semiglobifer]|nr:hypothetical protein BC832DRAFT_589461 [Gaertneriomyces semiglobifer]
MAENSTSQENSQNGTKRWRLWGFGRREQQKSSPSTTADPLVPWLGATANSASTSTSSTAASTHIVPQSNETSATATLSLHANDQNAPTPPMSQSTETVNPATLTPPSGPAPSTDFSQYSKYIIGAASLTAFGSMLYTARRRTRGEIKMPLQELFSNPAAAAANPKLTAYIFAGRAFTTATLITVTGFIGVTMAVASALQVNNLKEFSVRMREIVTTRFPQLRGADPDADSKFDPAYHEFLQFVSDDAAKEEEEGAWKENAGHAIIGNRVRHELGPLSRHQG